MPDNRIPPDLAQRMQRICDALGSVMPEGKGFALLVFDFGDGGEMHYMSNAERADMMVALREFLAANEGRAHDAPALKQ